MWSWKYITRWATNTQKKHTWRDSFPLSWMWLQGYTESQFEYPQASHPRKYHPSMPPLWLQSKYKENHEAAQQNKAPMWLIMNAIQCISLFFYDDESSKNFIFFLARYIPTTFSAQVCCNDHQRMKMAAKNNMFEYLDFSAFQQDIPSWKQFVVLHNHVPDSVFLFSPC